MPNVIRIGGNGNSGLVAICAEDGLLSVLEFPTMNPLDGHSVVFTTRDTRENRKLLEQKWDELHMKPQMISHVGLDVIRFDPEELEELGFKD